MIETTKNYEQFKILSGNRRIVGATVKDKIKLLSTDNNLDVFPVVVNENFEVIDGQHRFLACKEMGIPVSYVMKKGLTVKNAQIANSSMKNWVIQDFIDSFVESGNSNYMRYDAFVKKYKIKNVEIQYLLQTDTSTFSRKIKEGSFIFTEYDEIKSIDFLRVYLPIKSIFGRINFVFTRVFTKLYIDKKIDFSRLLKKAAMVPESYIRLGTNWKETYRIIEDIYNFKQSAGTHERLF
jgi:hypothetical protein